MISAWSRLSASEKRSVMAGAVIIGFVFLYQWIWLPMTARVIDMQAEVSHLAMTLAMAEEVNRVANHAIPAPKELSQWSSALRESLQSAGLATSLTQLQNIASDRIEMHFQQVSFDGLMRWLTQTAHTLPISVVAFSVEKRDEPGVVDAQLVLGV